MTLGVAHSHASEIARALASALAWALGTWNPARLARGVHVIELPDRTVLIGVDAGATEVKAHQVTLLSSTSAEALRIGPAGASCCYDRVSGFEPAPIEEQLAAQKGALERTFELPDKEREQGERWVDAATSSILSVAAQTRCERALVGIGMPGLKSADGRGVVVMRNGPRIPDFAQRLEQRLTGGGLELVRPIGPLTSDGDNCGRGEETDRQGLFRDVENAYYIGGGTGVAEALKLGGELVPFDRARSWIPKAWEMTTAGGHSVEDALSTRGINAIYAADAGRPTPIGPEEYPEERALAGDVVADSVMKEAALALAELVFERLVTLRHGPSREHAQERAEPRPTSQAPFRGTVLERVVVGQRLGRIFGSTCSK